MVPRHSTAKHTHSNCDEGFVFEVQSPLLPFFYFFFYIKKRYICAKSFSFYKALSLTAADPRTRCPLQQRKPQKQKCIFNHLYGFHLKTPTLFRNIAGSRSYRQLMFVLSLSRSRQHTLGDTLLYTCRESLKSIITPSGRERTPDRWEVNSSL